MATLAFPIFELERSVRSQADQARADTECVVTYARAGLTTIFLVIGKTIALRRSLIQLSSRQGRLLEELLRADFNHREPRELCELASSIESLLRVERTMLDEIADLGSAIRFWWNGPLRKLPEQIDHLDSIAESLNLASDPECITLLSLAAKQVASV